MNIEFLKSVLGDEGTAALNRAINKIPELKSVALPRTLLSWVNTIGSVGFEGKLPGKPDSYFSLVKSEDNTFSGALTIDKKLYAFNNRDALHVAASVGVALDIDFDDIDENIKNHNLTNLGKAIDLMVKGKFISELKKNFHESNKYGDFAIERYKGSYLIKHLPSEKVVFDNIFSLTIAKTMASWCFDKNEEILIKKQPKFNAHGPHAKPNEPHEPTEPVEPSIQPGYNEGQEPSQISNMTTGQGRKFKLKKQELEKVCTDCGEKIFKDKKFKGCLCLMDFSKNVKTITDSDATYLSFKDLPQEDIAAILSIIKD